MHTQHRIYLSPKSWLPLWVLLLLAVPLFFLNIHNTHSAGGDDYALYIHQAQNIATGKPWYQTQYLFNPYNNCYSPPHYPPGYPLLLAPIVKLWGIAIKPFCYFNSFVALCLLLTSYYYLRRHMSTVAAICIAVLITYSGQMIGLKQAVLSDTACLLFVMLYLTARQHQASGWGRVCMLAACAAMAILIRTQAVLLLLAEAVMMFHALLAHAYTHKRFQLRQLTHSRSARIIVVAALMSLLFNKVIFPAPASASGFYTTFLLSTLSKGLLTIVRDNINFYLESITSFFHYDTENSIRTALVTLIQSAGLLLCFIGFGVTLVRRLTFEHVFFVLVSGMVLYYPIHDPRYFLPVIVIVYFFCYQALLRLLPAITTVQLRFIGVGITVLCLYAGGRYLKSTLHTPITYVPTAPDYKAFDYIRTHVADSDIILCARPRLLTLYTGKKCIIHAWQHPMPHNKKVFDSMQVKYLLLMHGIVEDYYKTYLYQYQHPTDSVHIAPGYWLYTLR